MLKRILVALDASKTSEAAKELSIDLAKRTGASLTGIGVVDTPWITAAQPEPLGGAAYKIYRDDEVIRQSRVEIELLLSDFQQTCDKRKIACSSIEVEGFPATEIEMLAQEHDIIVIGRTADFHFENEKGSERTVRHIAEDNPRPLLVVPEIYKPGKSTLIAYDGSLQAARALHMFLLLGLAEGTKVHVLSIARNKKSAEIIARRAERMCEGYQVKVMAEGVTSSRDPAAIIKKKAKDVEAGMIVMGAFGHAGLREFFFGSTTENLMSKADIPLFIHH